MLKYLLPILVLPLCLSARENEATPVDRIRVQEGFEVQRLYSVPRDRQGSWVAMTIDDKDRFIVSDQYGPLHRVSVPRVGEAGEVVVEKIEIDIGQAQGLLYAFDSLYVVINTKEHGGRGLYRLRDTDGDDRYDEKTLLKKFEESGGEHGPHAVIRHPDGKSLCVVVGNQTSLPEGYDVSRVPERWGEDQLLPRVYGRGFMKGVEAPRGWIAKTDPEGKTWEILATGFRNQYDAAFDKHGELFTFDADMEWDLNTPWYRPTRVNHVVSGAEFGWRNGSAKWPAYYPDSLPAVVDIGPGSPTGVAFGYGAKFPAKYQDAFYIADWSYGKLYAVHLRPKGASFSATFEEFVAAQPLPLTDLEVRRSDGALYFAIGGRRVQSGLYRVVYTGKGRTSPAPSGASFPLVEKRKRLERFHGVQDGAAVPEALASLGSPDRFLRSAARVALEHQPVDSWRAQVQNLPNLTATVQGMVALARCGAAADRPAVLAALLDADLQRATREQRLGVLRAYALAFVRLGAPTDEEKVAIRKQLNDLYPAVSPEENIELSMTLAWLQDPLCAAKTIDLLENAPTQEEQIALARNIRLLEAGWNRELRTRYLAWLNRARSYKGGASFSKFVDEIRKTAIDTFPPEDRAALKEMIDAPPANTGPMFAIEPRSLVKEWKLSDLDAGLEAGLKAKRDLANGRNLFGAIGCFACHRFGDYGGAIGPHLSSVAGKFGPRDLLESILDPGKEISDQYGSMIFKMKDGSQIVGRLANLSGDSYRVITDLYNPGEMTSVDRNKVESVDPNPLSMMPAGMLNTLSESDIHDLLAYLLAGPGK